MACSKCLHSEAPHSEKISDVKKSYDTLAKRFYHKFQNLNKSNHSKTGNAKLELFFSEKVQCPKFNKQEPQKEESENVPTFQGEVQCLRNVNKDIAFDLNTRRKENETLTERINEI